MIATRERFRSICRGLGAKDNPNGTGRTIDSTYSELYVAYTNPDRHYHDINHINEGLELIDEIRTFLEEPVLIEASWWWHDKVYETSPTKMKLNEAMSGLEAFQALRELEAKDLFCVEVMSGIMPTLHSYIPVKTDHKFLVDIDLVRIAAPESDFDRNAEDLSKEYGITIEAFRIGQTQFFRNFMKNRSSVYLTHYFRERYEKMAQANIARVLSRSA